MKYSITYDSKEQTIVSAGHILLIVPLNTEEAAKAWAKVKPLMEAYLLPEPKEGRMTE